MATYLQVQIPERLIDENSSRVDGRRPDELRPIKMEVGVLDKADGSAYLEQGKNKILVAVYGPREAHPNTSPSPTGRTSDADTTWPPFPPRSGGPPRHRGGTWSSRK